MFWLPFALIGCAALATRLTKFDVASRCLTHGLLGSFAGYVIAPLVGALVGSVMAVVGSGLVEKAIKAMADLGVSGSIVRITPAVIGYAVLGAVVLGFFGGLYPAWRASSMRPVEAISKGV